MLGIMIGFPWLALIPAVLFAVLYMLSKVRLTLIASIIWLVYSVYEYGMYFRILCSGECNIRIDLLLIYPVLLTLTVVAAIKGFLAIKRRGKMKSQS